MSTFERRYYEYFLKSNMMPGWMKGERYEYCEPYAKPMKKRLRKSKDSFII